MAPRSDEVSRRVGKPPLLPSGFQSVELFFWSKVASKFLALMNNLIRFLECDRPCSLKQGIIASTEVQPRVRRQQLY